MEFVVSESAAQLILYLIQIGINIHYGTVNFIIQPVGTKPYQEIAEYTVINITGIDNITEKLKKTPVFLPQWWNIFRNIIGINCKQVDLKPFYFNIYIDPGSIDFVMSRFTGDY